MNAQRTLLLCTAVATLALALALPATAAPPPAPWVTQDIGAPSPAGSTNVDADGVWTLRGGGDADAGQYHYVYRPIRGDGSISARFQSVMGGPGVALVVRANNTPGGANVYYAMTRGAGLLAFARLEQDGVTGWLGPVGPLEQQERNLIFRLQRVGQEIAGFYSRDGQLWFQAGFGPVSLDGFQFQEEALFGLAISSDAEGALATGKVDQVELQQGVVSLYGLQACARDRAVLLQWRPLKNAIAYHVYRALAYQVSRGIASATTDQLVRVTSDAIAGTSFTDNSDGLVNGTPVLYAVAPVFRGADGSPVQGPLVAVQVTPVAVPSGMIGCGVNEGTKPGSAAVDPATGEITLKGSGADIWEHGDQFYFLSELVEGNVQITARMLSKLKNQGKPTGLMIRESLDGGARHMMVGISPGYGLVMIGRLTPDGRTRARELIPNTKVQVPVMLRLRRQGSTVTAEYSTDDGKHFTAGPPITFSPPLGRTLYVGLATTSGSRSSVITAQFNGLEIKQLP